MSRLAFFCATLLLGAVAVTPASAHALLLDSQPKAGAEVPGQSIDFMLRYNSRVDSGRSRLTVTDGRGVTRRLDSRRGADEASLTAHGEDFAAGKYNLHWEVLSVDGHISRGDLNFSVTAP